MNNKIEKKYVADKRRNSYGGTENDDSYLFRQAQQLSILFTHFSEPQHKSATKMCDSSVVSQK
jgi:hypothetical protein